MIPNKVPTFPLFGFSDVIMTCALTKMTNLVYGTKSIGKFDFWLKIVPIMYFDQEFLIKHVRKLQMLAKCKVWMQYIIMASN